MKKFILTLVSVIALVHHLQAQSDVSKSAWKSEGVVINGQADEWNRPLNFYEDKTGLNLQ